MTPEERQRLMGLPKPSDKTNALLDDAVDRGNIVGKLDDAVDRGNTVGEYQKLPLPAITPEPAAPAPATVPTTPITYNSEPSVQEVPAPISPAVYYNRKADEIDRQAMSDWQNMLSNARKSIEQERTDNIKMAKFAALGNVLRTMVQPLGWAIGGGRGVTGNVQVPDNREYLAAFNRAIKAGEDLRNIDMKGADLQLRYSQQMAQNARNISNLYMRYGMSHGTSAGVDMDKVYQDRITSALNQYVKDKNNWHAGAKPVAPTFDEHLRQIGLRWFGLEDSPEALAALEKIGEDAVKGTTGEAAVKNNTNTNKVEEKAEEKKPSKVGKAIRAAAKGVQILNTLQGRPAPRAKSDASTTKEETPAKEKKTQTKTTASTNTGSLKGHKWN